MLKLLELLELGDEMLATPEQVQAAAGGGPQEAPAPEGPTDTIAGGGLPQGVGEAAAPTAATGAMAGGEGHPFPLPTAM